MKDADNNTSIRLIRNWFRRAFFDGSSNDGVDKKEEVDRSEDRSELGHFSVDKFSGAEVEGWNDRYQSHFALVVGNYASDVLFYAG